jgi:hypothetical protein
LLPLARWRQFGSWCWWDRRFSDQNKRRNSLESSTYGIARREKAVKTAVAVVA